MVGDSGRYTYWMSTRSSLWFNEVWNSLKPPCWFKRKETSTWLPMLALSNSTLSTILFSQLWWWTLPWYSSDPGLCCREFLWPFILLHTTMPYTLCINYIFVETGMWICISGSTVGQIIWMTRLVVVTW